MRHCSFLKKRPSSSASAETEESKMFDILKRSEGANNTSPVKRFINFRSPMLKRKHEQPRLGRRYSGTYYPRDLGFAISDVAPEEEEEVSAALQDMKLEVHPELPELEPNLNLTPESEKNESDVTPNMSEVSSLDDSTLDDSTLERGVPSRSASTSTDTTSSLSEDKQMFPTDLLLSPKQMELKAQLDRIINSSKMLKGDGSFVLSQLEVRTICTLARERVMAEPPLVRVEAPVRIVGDIHGQFKDLLRIFRRCGFPPRTKYLFLGDYVDRGKESLETITTLFILKIMFPQHIHILRGNHECANVNKVYGFYDECARRSSIKSWKAYTQAFNCLPLAGVVSDRIFCVHGGLSPVLKSLKDVELIHRPTDVPEEGILNDLLWSDPSAETQTWDENSRGVSYVFGAHIVEEFLEKFDFDLVCRAHMVVEDGYEFFANRTLVTIFSAPNYCGEFDNKAAVMKVEDDLTCSFTILMPKKISGWTE